MNLLDSLELRIEFCKNKGGLAYVEAIRDGLIVVPFHKTLGLTFKEVSEGLLVAELEPDLDHIHGNSFGGMHGGAIGGANDSTGGFAGTTHVPCGFYNNATSYHTEFLRPVMKDTGTLTIISRVKHKEGSSMISEADVRDATGKVYATGLVRHVVLGIERLESLIANQI